MAQGGRDKGGRATKGAGRRQADPGHDDAGGKRLAPVLDWNHEIADFSPHEGAPEATFEQVADAEERTAVAALTELLSCDRLQAAYKLRPQHNGRFRLSGTVSADVVQACVISLEPVPAHIDAEFDVAFWPGEQITSSDDPDAAAAIDADQDIETIVEGRIEAGRIIYEVLALSLDPYPRAPGIAFDAEALAQSPEPEKESPFAALARLKGKS